MAKFGLAQPVRRVEDPRLLKGDGRYTDDIVLPGMLHGVVLRSPHAAAIVRAIDTAAAASAPGVKAVYTAADLNADGIGSLPCAVSLTNRDGSAMASPPQRNRKAAAKMTVNFDRVPYCVILDLLIFLSPCAGERRAGETAPARVANPRRSQSVFRPDSARSIRQFSSGALTIFKRAVKGEEGDW